MKNLINTLTEQTQQLRAEFIAKTMTWAANDFDALTKWADEYSAGKHGFGEASKKYYRLPDCVMNHKNYTHHGKNPMQRYVDQAVKNAEAHYVSSIAKLAERISAKGLNESSLKIETAYVGVNIETTLTDGVKTVKAWTIIASGEVQKPHYRYLIK
jgi:hypothetical protein